MEFRTQPGETKDQIRFIRRLNRASYYSIEAKEIRQLLRSQARELVPEFNLALRSPTLEIQKACY